MTENLLSKISKNFQNYNVEKIEGGASKKKFYRLCNNSNSYILSDFNADIKEYNNHLRIYEILKELNVSIPRIFERYDDDLITISQDFGKLRYDKIILDYNLKDLLSNAVETLIIFNKSIKYNIEYQLPQYDHRIFESEIMEMSKYYFPYIKLDNKNLIKDFYEIWFEAFQNISFEFKSFVHKDFNINNLILIPDKKNHLKCGVIDYQSAFWGDNSWDLFSLLEDSRVLFSDEYNDYFIDYFYSKIKSDISIKDFKNKYYFLSSSRQTRLLGRWIKLAEDFDQKFYLKFIPITLSRLKKSINFLDNNNLIKFYNKYIFD